MIIQNSSRAATPNASSISISNSTPAAPVRAQVSAAPVAQATSIQPPTPVESLSSAVASVNASLAQSGSSLQFKIDRETATAIVTMVDSNTGEVIRQIPSEEVLAITRAVDEMMQRNNASCESGVLCKQTA